MWYGADPKYLAHGGRGAKWFEVNGAELKNVDSLTFTIAPGSGPVRRSSSAATQRRSRLGLS